MGHILPNGVQEIRLPLNVRLAAACVNARVRACKRSHKGFRSWRRCALLRLSDHLTVIASSSIAITSPTGPLAVRRTRDPMCSAPLAAGVLAAGRGTGNSPAHPCGSSRKQNRHTRAAGRINSAQRGHGRRATFTGERSSTRASGVARSSYVTVSVPSGFTMSI